MKRLKTDTELREGFQAAFRDACIRLRHKFEQLSADGSTPAELAYCLLLSNPFPGQPDYERLCEMALAGEFDEFFSELLAVSQN